ncbi:hypothetical protein HDU96_002051 [Phlyctochytrium bullatum]|nr:hypothetical protein HDU96_002051 [Phlyctochytrium bullatum]
MSLYIISVSLPGLFSGVPSIYYSRNPQDGPFRYSPGDRHLLRDGVHFGLPVVDFFLRGFQGSRRVGWDDFESEYEGVQQRGGLMHVSKVFIKLGEGVRRYEESDSGTCHRVLPSCGHLQAEFTFAFGAVGAGVFWQEAEGP